MECKNYEDHRHRWSKLSGGDDCYSGFDWCEICGTVRTKLTGRKRNDYRYRKPETFRKRLFDIRTNGTPLKTKICATCKNEKPVASFNKNSQTPDGLKYICRSCTRDYFTKNRSKILARQRAIPSEIKAGYVRKYDQSNPEKKKAQTIVSEAIRTGIIIKPVICQDCDKEKPLDGHHEDYDKPLDVIWVCRACHKLRHMDKTIL